MYIHSEYISSWNGGIKAKIEAIKNCKYNHITNNKYMHYNEKTM